MDMAAPAAPWALEEIQAPPHTDWLRHLLTISGPAAEMARFRVAAAGAGVIPWVLDLAGMEEDWLLQLAAPEEDRPAISLSGAKILARRLREAAAANQARALSRLDQDRRCPFDLHRLVPVPPTVLALGPDHPQALAWLWSHWGTTRALRQVRLLPGGQDRRSTRTDRMDVEFWSADWSPWRALARLRRDWPVLVLDLRPQYGEEEAPQARPKAVRRRGR
ncbi:hypothetical protein [Roseomonas marmotae]|uniref:Uncharacterized protein n=1 Tax=Roseomonas marmotae TaxID=2768161 RepID=A0ABS3KCL4_9PROT|nr:hypothetical protein [Roseomonas marmotae]MBO1074660.1 hypothetical protein [Roseomonas marmotae]QTI81679.1 hypothetical protein IAI58_20370 [Roseomonas marmotae]